MNGRPSRPPVQPAGFVPEAGAPLIQAVGLKREYLLGRTRVQALQGVDLTIHAGEFVALMGASGSGKSTLMHLLGCLDEPSAGQYLLEGRDTSKLPPRERAELRSTRLGFVFQNFFLLPDLNAIDNVALPLLYQRGFKSDSIVLRQRAIEALAQVGLAQRAGHRPMELSGGERQRVAIARALITRPALLLADEPTGNLDSATGLELMSMLTELWVSGLTVLLVTHDQNVASFAPRVVYMKDGRIVHEETRQSTRILSNGNVVRAETPPKGCAHDSA